MCNADMLWGSVFVCVGVCVCVRELVCLAVVLRQRDDVAV